MHGLGQASAEGFEPTTFCSGGRCSIQLSYADITSLTIVTGRITVQLIAACSGRRRFIHRRRGSRPAEGEKPATAEPAAVRVTHCDRADLPEASIPGVEREASKAGPGRVRGPGSGSGDPMQPTGSRGVSERTVE